MKILLATYWAIPHVGGVWPFMLQLQKQLQARGHEVDLLGNGGDPGSTYVSLIDKAEIKKDKLRPLLAEKLNKTAYPAIHKNQLVLYTEFERYLFELSAAYLNLDQYDVIHTQDVIATGCLERVRSKKTALVASLHGSVAHEVERQLTTIHKSSSTSLAKAYFNALEHFGASSSDSVIVANQWLKNILTQEFTIPEGKIRMYPYGYDQDAFAKRASEPPNILRPTGKKVIMFAGRLIEQKGMHHVISALGELKKLRDDWVCWIVGDGDQQVKLRTQCTSLGLENDISFLGRRDDIPQLLHQADLFVQPSLLDNQPLSVIEAQLAGLPVIVTDAGGLPEMVTPNRTGLISPIGDIQSLSGHMNLLIGNDEFRKQMGVNAKAWAIGHWSLDRMIDRYLEIYEYALSKRRVGHP